MIKRRLLWFLFVALCLTIQACKEQEENDDEMEQTDENPEEEEVSGVVSNKKYDHTLIKIPYAFSADFLSFFDVEIKTTDFDGKEETIKVEKPVDAVLKAESKAMSGEAFAEFRVTLKESLPSTDSVDYFNFRKMATIFIAAISDEDRYINVKSCAFPISDYKKLVYPSDIEKLDSFKKSHVVNSKVKFSFKITKSTVDVSFAEVKN